MIHGIAWIVRALFYAAFVALIIFYILQLPIEAQDPAPTRPTPVAVPCFGEFSRGCTLLPLIIKR
jgi:hypothetical protein